MKPMNSRPGDLRRESNNRTPRRRKVREYSCAARNQPKARPSNNARREKSSSVRNAGRRRQTFRKFPKSRRVFWLMFQRQYALNRDKPDFRPPRRNRRGKLEKSHASQYHAARDFRKPDIFLPENTSVRRSECLAGG